MTGGEDYTLKRITVSMHGLARGTLYNGGLFQWGKVLHLKGVSFFGKGDESAQFRFQFTASISERKGGETRIRICFSPFQALVGHVLLTVYDH